MSVQRHHVVWALLVAAGLALVAFAEARLSGYERTVMGFAGIYAMLAVSLSFSNGLTGLFSLGHPAFMMVGGYVAAILTFPANRKGFMLPARSEEHTSELQSRGHLVCRLLLEKKNKTNI